MIAALIAICAPLGITQEPREDVPSKEVIELVDDNARFAFELYGEVRAGEGNLCLSPQSISTALAMTYAGARGKTAEEMKEVLHFDLPATQLDPAFHELSEALTIPGGEGQPKVVLSIANRLWAARAETFRSAYLERIGKWYAGGVETIDFADPSSAAERINAWVAHKTLGHIEKLLTPGDVRGASFVLTNAIAFQGEWEIQFEPEKTEDLPFELLSGESVRVPTMVKKEKYRFARTDLYQALELPFEGDRFSMVFLLPNAADKFAELERSMGVPELTRALDAMEPVELTVLLPRFEFSSRFELGGALQAMGMHTAFNGKADFSGMFEAPGVLLSSVIHEGFIKVNEKGAEAAAATAVVGVRALAPLLFRADRPFMFLIRDRKTGALLFIGRVTDPRS